MPPASKTKTANKAGSVSGSSSGGVAKSFKRDKELNEEFQDALLQSQLKASSELCDVNLICDGGVIPAHAALLSAVSPFFEKAIASQGDNYLITRDIILPDFTIAEIQKVMQLLYTGVCIVHQNELNSLKDTMTSLQLETLGSNDIDINRIGSKAAEKEAGVLIRIRNAKDKMVKGEVLQLDSDQEKRLKKRKKKYNNTDNSDDSDYDPKEDRDDNKHKSKNKTSSSKSVVVGPRNYNGPVNKPQVAAIVPNRIVNVNNSKTTSNNNDDCNNTDDDNEWEEPNYSDKKWFDREAKRCQFCKKEHENPAQASMCITGHQRLRCYFCFRVCKNTEKLFEHFKNQHKQAGRENCLLCPYCEQTIPFKSVSCHVISLHLSDMRAGSKSNETSKTVATIPSNRPRIGPGRPGSGVVVRNANSISSDAQIIPLKQAVVLLKATDRTKFKNDEPASKKPKRQVLQTTEKHTEKDSDGLIRAGNLDVTISRRGIDGRLWIWRIQKTDDVKNDLK